METKYKVDETQIKQFTSALLNRGQVVEVRALDANLHSDKLPYDKPRVISGYFDNADNLATSIAKIVSAAGVYVTINPCVSDLLARAYNHFKDKKIAATTDEQIVARHWLMLDLDPDRAGGKVTGISATDEEHQIALDFAQTIRDGLTQKGWPRPIEIDSGNGAYLIYAVDLPAQDDGLVQKVLVGLGQLFDTQQIHVDQTTFNQARIVRIPGTWNCKGDDMPARPHRIARLLAMPEEIIPVPSSLLEAVAKLAPEAPAQPETRRTSQPRQTGKDSAPKTRRTSRNTFSVEQFLEKHEIPYLKREAYKGGTKWLLEACPFCNETDHNATVYDFPDTLGFKCSHNRCKDYQWKDFRLFFEPDYVHKKYGASQCGITAWEVSDEEILEYLAENEYGDARLFKCLFDGQVLYDRTSKEWYIWRGHYWERDKKGKVELLVSGEMGAVYLRSIANLNPKLAELEARVDAIIAQSLTAEDSKQKELKEQLANLKGTIETLRKRAIALRTAKRNRSVQMFIQSEMPTTSDEWDTHPWLLATPNGVIDLKTGQIRDGEPEDLIRTVCPTEWEGIDAPCPRFERFLQEIFEDKPDRDVLIAFLQRLLGMAIVGEVTNNIFPILYGEEGRNGKDTLFTLLKFVLGALVGAVNNDVFIAQDRNRTAGAATPHLVELQGKRLVWGSETKQGDKFNVAQVKQLTGGGDIPARKNYGEAYSFKPSHTLALMTNSRPHADAKDKAFWSRVVLIEFGLRFIDEPIEKNERLADTKLNEALKKEAAGVLAWLVRGCLDWQEQGLNPPESVKMANKKYREDEDTLLQFIEACCITRADVKAAADKLYETYILWCKSNNIVGMNGINFGKDMGKRYERKRGNKGNIYIGIGILTEPVYSSGDGVYDGAEPYTPSEASSEASSDTTEKDTVYNVYDFDSKVAINGKKIGDNGYFDVNTIHTLHSEGVTNGSEASSEASSDTLFNPTLPYTRNTSNSEDMSEIIRQHFNGFKLRQWAYAPDCSGEVSRVDPDAQVLEISYLGKTHTYRGAGVLTVKVKSAV